MRLFLSLHTLKTLACQQEKMASRMLLAKGLILTSFLCVCVIGVGETYSFYFAIDDLAIYPFAFERRAKRA